MNSHRLPPPQVRHKPGQGALQPAHTPRPPAFHGQPRPSGERAVRRRSAGAGSERRRVVSGPDEVHRPGAPRLGLRGRAGGGHPHLPAGGLPGGFGGGVAGGMVVRCWSVRQALYPTRQWLASYQPHSHRDQCRCATQPSGRPWWPGGPQGRSLPQALPHAPAAVLKTSDAHAPLRRSYTGGVPHRRLLPASHRAPTPPPPTTTHPPRTRRSRCRRRWGTPRNCAAGVRQGTSSTTQPAIVSLTTVQLVGTAVRDPQSQHVPDPVA